jgi:fucose permease
LFYVKRTDLFSAGRFLLTPLCQKVGEKRAVFGLILGAAVFQSLVWAVPNIITNAVAESIVGLFLGPVYPCSVAVLSMIWPRKIQTSSLSLVTSMGSSGAAIIPFITGLVSQATSTVALHPIVLFSFASMVGAWLALPKIQKRTE